MTKRAAKRKGEPRDGAKKIDILTCVVCGKQFERRLLRNCNLPRKNCSEACRARAWRNNPCRPPSESRPKSKQVEIKVEPRSRPDSVYRRVHEMARQFAGLRNQVSEGWSDGDE